VRLEKNNDTYVKVRKDQQHDIKSIVRKPNNMGRLIFKVKISEIVKKPSLAIKLRHMRLKSDIPQWPNDATG